MYKTKKIVTTFEAIEKIKNFCAYSEKSHFDVRKKLQTYNLDKNSIESIISTLIEENFLNESRYTKAFIHGKLVINHWGRNKITYELNKHNVSKKSIELGFKEIDEDLYLSILNNEILKKNKLKYDNDFEKRNKITNYLLSKGFEIDLIKKNIDNII